MKYYDFFSKHVANLPSPNEKGDVLVPCVFHKDSSPSLGINLASGKWRCFTPRCVGHKGGGYKKFEQLLKGAIPGAEVTSEDIDPALIEAHHKVLLGSRVTMDLLRKKRGFSDETIKRFKLGYDADRIWIPIPDDLGHYVNVRKYKPGAKKDKMVAFGAGYNRARLFPIENIKSDWVLLCEGETDCILASQYGYPAITTTGGADTWREEFCEQLRGKKVFICYDADKAGKTGAQQVAVRLLGYAKQVAIVKLPLPGTNEEKDITNYFVDLGHGKDDFDALLEAAEVIEDKAAADASAPAEEILDLHLSQIGEDQFVGKRVKSNILIAGKDLAPFQVPWRVGYTCGAMGSEKICDRCGICKAGGTKEVQIPEWSDELIKMTNIPAEKLEWILANLAGVPDRCRKFDYEVKEHANIESVKAIPEIDFSAEHAEYVIRNLYYLGHGLDTNRTYDVEAVVMPDPKTQYATALIYRATPAQNTIEKFDISEEDAAQLKIFQVTQ